MLNITRLKARVDDLIPQAERRQLGQVTLLLIVAAIATALFGFVQSLSLLRVRGRMDAVTQSAVWDRLLRLPMSFFRDYTAGDLAMRAMGINAISATLSMVSLHSVFSGAFSIFSLGLLFWYDWRLASIALVLVAIATIVSAALYWAQLQYQRPLMTVVGRIWARSSSCSPASTRCGWRRQSPAHSPPGRISTPSRAGSA